MRIRATLPRAPLVFFAAAILATLAVHALADLSAYDDAFITFRYVRNFVGGRGAVYNTGEHVFGISTPLYAVWLSLLHFVMPSISIPVLAARGNALFLVAAGILACRLVVRLGAGRWIAALAGAAVMLSDGILRASIGGMESSMFLALALGSALASLSRRDATALLLAGLTALVRPEGALLVLIVLAARLADPATRSLPPRLWLATAPMIVWTVGATLYYGSPVPHSVVAKSRPLYPLPAGAALGNLLRHAGAWTLDGLLLVGRTVTSDAPARAASALFTIVGTAVTLWALWRWRRPAGLRLDRSFVLPGFLIAVAVLYTVTNPYLMPWYFPLFHAPWLIMVFMAAAPAAPGDETAGSPRRAGRLAVPALACVTAFGLFLSHLAPSDWSLLTRGASSAKQASVLDAYRRAAAWVESHSEASEVVAAPEIGVLGFHLDRRIMDACGLVTPEAVPFLPVPLEQRGGQQGVISVDFVRSVAPDLVVTLVTFARPSLLRSEWFDAAYALVHEEPVLATGEGDGGVLVFRKRALPAAAAVRSQ